VAARVEIAEVEAILEARLDAREPSRDLAGHERLTAQRRLVIEQDAVARVYPVGLSVIHRDPVRVDLRGRVRRARIERRRLALRRLDDAPEHLRRGRLIEARMAGEPADPDGLEQTQRAER